MQHEDPNWPRASAWLAGKHYETAISQLSIIGAPVRLGSITSGRCDLAPQEIRNLLRKFSCYDIESDTDLHHLKVVDHGDLQIEDLKLEEAFEPIKTAVRFALDTSDTVVILGGDNGVTRPGVHGITDKLNTVGLITIDAHLDLRDTTNGLLNGNPVRALLDDGMPGSNIVQIGIQSFANSREYAQVAKDAGIKLITMGEVRARGIDAVINNAFQRLKNKVDAIYVDFDIDALDRIFAPATPGSRPGGFTPWELKRIAWLCGSHPLVKAIDLVEVDPTNDIADATVMTTASTLLSFAAGVINR